MQIGNFHYTVAQSLQNLRVDIAGSSSARGIQSEHCGQKWRFSTSMRENTRISHTVSRPKYGHGYY